MRDCRWSSLSHVHLAAYGIDECRNSEAGDVKLIGVSRAIAVLNIFDGLATHYGLAYGIIEEANPAMDLLWKASPLLFLGAKVGLSVLILHVSELIFQKSAEAFRRLYAASLSGVLCLYVGISFLHIAWLALL